jgi:hypothetical protein
MDKDLILDFADKRRIAAPYVVVEDAETESFPTLEEVTAEFKKRGVAQQNIGADR